MHSGRPTVRRIFFDVGGQIYRMDVATSGEPEGQRDPVALPIKGFQQGDLRRQYDLTPDGKGFVMLFRCGGRTRREVICGRAPQRAPPCYSARRRAAATARQVDSAPQRPHA